jgi:hypothetical protein
MVERKEKVNGRVNGEWSMVNRKFWNEASDPMLHSKEPVGSVFSPLTIDHSPEHFEDSAFFFLLLFQCLLQVGNDIFLVFYTHIHSDEAIRNAVLLSLLTRYAMVCHGSGMREQGIYRAQ